MNNSKHELLNLNMDARPVMKRSTHSSRVGTLLFICMAIVLLLAMPAAACPLCDGTIAQENSSGLGDGMSYSTLGLIGMPFLLFGTVAGIVIRAYRRHRPPQFTELDDSHMN
jgi:hypothetical protein